MKMNVVLKIGKLRNILTRGFGFACFLSLLFVSVYAQSSSIEIGIAEYDTTSHSAKIFISNVGNGDLNIVTLKIDDGIEIPVVDLLSPGNTVYSLVGVNPGEHVILVGSGDGTTASKKLLFSKSKDAIIEDKEAVRKFKEETSKREEELKKIADENMKRARAQLDQELENSIKLGIVEKDRTGIVLIVLGAIFILGIVVWIILRNRK